ncbi:MAG: site-specific integrase [Pseudomonadota bacterium]|nr:site-specific integrase [Pseudomonadota bacterium]
MSERFVPKAIFFDAIALSRTEPHLMNMPKDYAKVRLFLLSYALSSDTYNTYRREVERYCQWLWYVAQSSLEKTTRHMVHDYIKFFQSPPSSWISPKHYPRFINDYSGQQLFNPDWRPFVVKPGQKRTVSQSAMKSMIACLSTFYTFLMHEEVVSQNPVQMLTQKKQILQTVQTTRIKRRLSQTQWGYVVDVVKCLAGSHQKYERHLYILSLFYLLGVRISEISQNEKSFKPMNLFYQDNHNRWWFEALGKGNKVRSVAVPDAMLEGLARYRRTLGLSPLPTPDDLSPLVPKLRGAGGLSARQLRVLVSEAFGAAVDALIRDGLTHDASNLKQATVHWLRHTSISDDVMLRPSEHVRDDVGHENIATTSLYIDVLDEKRHATAKDKKLKQD